MKAISSLVVVAVSSSWVSAVDLLVPEEHSTIREALDRAGDGDRVLVGPGEYLIDQPLVLGNFAVTLQSREGPRTTTIRMVETARFPEEATVIVITKVSATFPTTVLEGFTITGGRGSRSSFNGESNVGGGILCARGASPSIRNCRIASNSARKGGGVYCDEFSSPDIRNCTITGNTARFSGGGVYSHNSSRPRLENTTLAGNAGLYGGGLYCQVGAAPEVKNSILWGNAGESIFVRGVAWPVITFSDLEAEQPFPGAGNLNVDPLFCAWGDRQEVFVDAARTEPGEGSRESPFRDLQEALAGHSLALSSRSPCLGAGEGGADMGAGNGTCAEPGMTSRLLRLLPGRYRLEGMSLAGVSIDGAGEDETLLEGTVLGLRTGSRLAGVTVTGGTRGGIAVGRGEKPEIRDSRVRGNFSEYVGGGIHAYGAAPLITGVKITDNVAVVRGGGLYCEEASLPVLVHCTIAGNSAGEWGGVALAGSFLTLESSIVWNNAGGSDLGPPGAYSDVSFSCLEGALEPLAAGNIAEDPRFCGWPAREVHVDEQRPGPGTGTPADPFPTLAAALQGFSVALSPGSPCRGTGEGGADMGAIAAACGAAGAPEQLVRIARGSYEIEGLNLASRVSLLGSGAEETTLSGTARGLRTGFTIEGLTISAGSEGGLLVTSGEAPAARRAAFTGGPGSIGIPGLPSSTNGVKVLPRAAVTLLECSLRENSASGLHCYEGASAVLIDCEVSGNARAGLGGEDSVLRIESSMVAGNGGAGIAASWSSLEIRGSTIAGNDTGLDVFASAVVLEDCMLRDQVLSGAQVLESLVTLTSCLIAGNGLIGLELQASTALLTNCTIADHRLEAFGGGVLAAVQAAVSLHNSILWGNAGGSLLLEPGTALRASFSLSEGPEILPGEGNLNADPLFAGAGDYHLRPGSPAIDAGAVPGAPATDIDGNGRPCGGGVDLGAFEAGGCAPAGTRFRRGEATGDGASDLADAIASLEHLFQGRPAPSCPKSLDVNDDGALDLTDPVLLLAHLFLGGAPPQPPFAECGLDPTLDLLACESFPGCG